MNTKYHLSITIVLFLATVITSCEDEQDKIRDLSGAISISPSIDVTIGSELTATYSGNEIVTYQWNRGETAIGGATGNKYTPSIAGIYTVTVSAKGYNSMTSVAVEITVKYFTISFNTDDGNEAPSDQTVTYGSTATKPPQDPTKAWTSVAGLYAGTPPEFYIFDGWYLDDKKWDFNTDQIIDDITLKAKWMPPTPIDISGQTGDDILTQAVNYARTKPAMDFTLLLDTDIATGNQSTSNTSRFKLTLIGLGEERTITYSGEAWNRLFNLYNGASLTIGQNITFKGTLYNTSAIDVGSNSTLTMLDGSKITGFSFSWASGVIGVSGSGRFIMEGGEISGNSSTSHSNNSTGGVHVIMGGTIVVRGGKITDNYIGNGNTADVYLQSDYNKIELSDETEIGTLVLATFTAQLGQGTFSSQSASAFTANSYLGKVEKLHLYGNCLYLSDAINWWNGKSVIHVVSGSLSQSVVEKFNSFLGDFCTNGNDRRPINNTHELVLENGVGVLKEK